MKTLILLIAFTLPALADKAGSNAHRNSKYDQASTMDVVKAIRADIAALGQFDHKPMVKLIGANGRPMEFRVFKVMDDSVEVYNFKTERKMILAFKFLSKESVNQLREHKRLINDVALEIIELKADLEAASADHQDVRRNRVSMNRTLFYHRYTVQGKFKRIGTNVFPTIETPSAFRSRTGSRSK